MKRNLFESKLASLIKETYDEKEAAPEMTTEAKKRFLEAVNNFHEHANGIYRDTNLKEISTAMNEIVEIAEQLTLQESEHWFDNVTVSRHMKQLKEAHKVFEKTAADMTEMQQRLEAAYDDMGSILNKYYKVNESLR
jgi:hypothetical protein